jgi:hypothetical protein
MIMNIMLHTSHIMPAGAQGVLGLQLARGASAVVLYMPQDKQHLKSRVLHSPYAFCMQVPKVYWDYSTPEVLVLEYCPGTKINDGAALDAQGLDRQRLARLAVESYLQQILNHGFFHAGES